MTPEVSEKQLGWLLIAPAAAIICLVAVYPILSAVNLSFHHIQLQFPGLGRPFCGLQNYIDILRWERFWHSLGTTVVFSTLTVTSETVLGLALALVMNRASRIQGFTRSAALVPWAFTTVVSALMWKFIYDTNFGLLNGVLYSRLHLIAQPRLWLGDPHTALLCAVVADVWKTTPFMALLILAGLQGVSKEVYEAGRIDGTTRWQAFLNITLPMLKPTLLVALLFRSLDAFRVFDLIFVLTQGGPGNATESLSYLTYIKLFGQFDFGQGSALSVLTFLCVMGISFIYVKVLGAEVRS
ncbi:MAG TPA: sugar ABC transporter permease [Candidatus Xenobia bacterium]|jgi:multiple sugar transport system permease protein